ncbi:DUF4131 domain-containing protein [Rhizobium sp. BR 314]|uniref:DUF4131 domain-containing protein n=1 Tax=Rhizobium sp. BR 314 TaxID=3040013 RepID=UPI0039BF270E
MPNLEAPEQQEDGRDLALPSLDRHAVASITLRIKTGQRERTQDQVSLIVRFYLALGRMRVAIGRLIEEEAVHGRAILLAPIYMGVGAIFWFTFDSDPPLQTVLAVLLLLTCGFVFNREAGRLLRHLLFAGMLTSLGMALAHWESWRASTIMLDSAVTTTVTGRIERRETYDNGRWRYIVKVDATENPSIHRPPERVTIYVRKQAEPFNLGDRIQVRARLTPPAGPALPRLNDFAFSAYFNGIGANGFAYGPPILLSLSSDNSETSWLAKVDIWLAGLRNSIGTGSEGLCPAIPEPLRRHLSPTRDGRFRTTRPKRSE